MARHSRFPKPAAPGGCSFAQCLGGYPVGRLAFPFNRSRNVHARSGHFGRRNANLSPAPRARHGSSVHFHSRRRRRHTGIFARFDHSVRRLVLQPIHDGFTGRECRIHRMGNDCGRPRRERRGVRIRFFSFRMQRLHRHSPAGAGALFADAIRPEPPVRRSMGSFSLFSHFVYMPHRHPSIPMDRPRVPPERSCLPADISGSAVGRERPCRRGPRDSRPCARSTLDSSRPLYVLGSG